MSKSILSIILAIAVLYGSIVCFTASAGADATSKTTILIGDVDYDGKITVADARFILRAAIGLEGNFVYDDRFTIADVSCDANLTVEDARLCLREAIGLNKYIVSDDLIGTADDPIQFDSRLSNDPSRAGQFYCASCYKHCKDKEAALACSNDGEYIYYDENGNRHTVLLVNLTPDASTPQYCKDCGQYIYKVGLISAGLDPDHKCSEKNWLLYNGKHYNGCFCEYCGAPGVLSKNCCRRAVCDTVCDWCGKAVSAWTCHHCTDPNF